MGIGTRPICGPTIPVIRNNFSLTVGDQPCRNQRTTSVLVAVGYCSLSYRRQGSSFLPGTSLRPVCLHPLTNCFSRCGRHARAFARSLRGCGFALQCGPSLSLRLRDPASAFNRNLAALSLDSGRVSASASLLCGADQIRKCRSDSAHFRLELQQARLGAVRSEIAQLFR